MKPLSSDSDSNSSHISWSNSRSSETSSNNSSSNMNNTNEGKTSAANGSKYCRGTVRTKLGLAEMLKGGVIMDVTTPEQARIAEKAGACAVMALEQIPADIRKSNGVARMADPALIKSIMKAVTIPVMAKCRIGHQTEAQVLQEIGVDFIDESEVLTPADDTHHIYKSSFCVPFVCGCKDLGEALRRIAEGASMIRTKGEAGTGNIMHAIKHIRAVRQGVHQLVAMDEEELFATAKEIRAPLDLLQQVKKMKRLPVVNFAAGGVATPADAAFCMQLGVDGVFVGSGIFKSTDPERRARAIVEAVTHYEDAAHIAAASEGLGGAMHGVGNLNESSSFPVMRWAERE